MCIHRHYQPRSEVSDMGMTRGSAARELSGRIRSFDRHLWTVVQGQDHSQEQLEECVGRVHFISSHRISVPVKGRPLIAQVGLESWLYSLILSGSNLSLGSGPLRSLLDVLRAASCQQKI
jgi:hypothetical protein